MSFDELHNPYALLLALLVPPYVVWLLRPGRTAAVRYPSVRNLKRLPRTIRQRCRAGLPILRGLALLALVVVMARPLRQIETDELPSEGIAILMLLDRSSSMGDPNNKLLYQDTLQFRFDVAKHVAIDFIDGNDDALDGRPNDLIGLTTFAGFPESNYPFTLFHNSLVAGLKRMGPVQPLLTPSANRPGTRPRRPSCATRAVGGAIASTRWTARSSRPPSRTARTSSSRSVMI